MLIVNIMSFLNGIMVLKMIGMFSLEWNCGVSLFILWLFECCRLVGFVRIVIRGVIDY